MNAEKSFLDYPGTDPGWWLTAGAECCYFCEAQVHAEALTYCIDCDQPICPVCYLIGEDLSEVVCPACAEQPEE